MSYPDYTPAERWADGIVHVVGVISAVIAVGALFWVLSDQMGWSIFLATGIYAAALILMLTASAAYHMAAHTSARPILRRLDHAAIYLKIAGSFTPLAIVLGTMFGYVVLGLVWAFALFGARTKLMAKRGRMTTGWLPYVALGWGGIALLVPLWSHLPAQSVWLLVAGGLIYTGAVVFYAWESLRFANALWHGFVLLATGVLFAGISTSLTATL